MKKFRREKGNTQQELADHLGISIQAVSKWECGDGYPDITLIPALALYYNVTSDRLLGMEENVINAKIAEYEKRFNEITRKTKNKDKWIAVWREAQKEFPNNHTVLYNLLFAIWWKKENYNETIEIGERLLKESTDNNIRHYTIYNLFMACVHNNDNENAKKYANMASPLSTSRDVLYFQCLLNSDREEAFKEIQQNIQRFMQLFYSYFIRNLFEMTDSPEEKIKICKSALTIFQSIYVDKDFGMAEYWIADIYHKFARCHAFLGSTDKALSYLNEMAEHYIKNYTLGDFKHTSFMVDRISYDGINYGLAKTYVQEAVTEIIKEIEERESFDCMRNDERYVAAMEKMKNLFK